MSDGRASVVGALSSLVCALAVIGFLAACAPLQLTRPVFKIGLLAPFEGQARAVGYEALYAVKLALRERNGTGGVAGWSVELVALDDGDQIVQTVEQARMLAVDPDVMRGLFVLNASERATISVQFGPHTLTLQAVQADTSPEQLGAQFAADYRAISGGITPTILAASTYAATQHTLREVEQRILLNGGPTR
ncbi:MAG: ABC transporter substrate-binding protein [Chloroflexi bacterium]|nr:ABC transporter substrate-binding protein [Chloroflexota bacterium]